ncbi:MAG TPA: hypothetical protein VIN08_08415 [Ohtaekwangia sp.]|uniref:hypothetical protein n=1 Tax=Ohtaekwangia sp. TaxID=2066019 RepID=UPI002F943B5C
MNYKYKLASLIAISALVYGTSCSDPDYAEPVPATSASNLSANFLFVNASPDAPSLDLFINNVKSGNSVVSGANQDTYTAVPIVSNGVFANTNIRAKASSGTIGGVLGSSDLIYRAGNNNSNNFQASANAYYTIFAVDTTDRVKPLRTLNASSFGDTTFFNPPTGKQLSVVERKALSAEAKAKLVPLGTIPLGSSDPGGVRFLVLTETLPSPAAGKVSVRFIHLSPDAGTLTATLGATSVTSGIFSYPMRFPTFTPSVGSRGTTAGFQTIDAGTYDAVVKSAGNEVSRLDAQTLTEKSVYTVYITGVLKDGTLKTSIIKHK